MSEINCNNCAISDFKESLCERCDEMKRLGRADDIEKLLIKAFSEVDSPAKSDCISRQGAIDVVDKFSDADGCNGSDVAMDIISGLISLPSVQPEIIHCRDCKYYTPVTARCEVRGKGLYLIRGNEDYCSRAERRTDGTNAHSDIG